jgi:iron complex outermembrane recepter protein
MKATTFGLLGRSKTAMRQHRWLSRICVLIALSFQCCEQTAIAEDFLNRQITLDIPDNTPLDEALLEWANKVGVALMINTPNVDNKRTHGVRGTQRARKALYDLLRDSGLSYTAEGDRISVVPVTSIIRSGQHSEISESSKATSESAENEVQTPVVQDDTRRSDYRHDVRLEEVVVTARKSIERLQDVPMSVAVVNATSMVQQDALSVQDYYATVPGLTINDSGGSGHLQITMRGLSAGFGNPTVGVTIDDVPIGATNTSNIDAAQLNVQLDPADLQRIEFLKGPQGTLYGASTIAGVMRYVTALPDFASISGHVEVDGEGVHGRGGYGYGIRGSTNIPLIADTLAVRVSAFDRRDPGYVSDPSHGRENVNWTEVYGGHFDAFFQPVQNFSARLSALYQRTEGHGISTVDTNYLYQPIFGDLTQNRLPGTGGYHDELQLYSLTLKFQSEPFEVTSITGYSFSRHYEDIDSTPGIGFLADIFFPPAQGATVINDFNSGKLTQEIRVSSQYGSTLEWQLGGFYTNEDNGPNSSLLTANDLNTGTQVGVMLYETYPSRYQEYAGFANLTYHFTNRFDVQVGGRESRNRIRYFQELTGPLGVGAIPYLTRSDDSSFTYLVTPRLRLSDTFMTYARVASGYQAGGPNTPFSVDSGIPLTFGPSKTVNYEVGIKRELFDKRLLIDGDIFYIDWSQIQLGAVTPLSAYTFNGGKAKSKGLEVAAQFTPVEGLTLGVAGAYTDAYLTTNSGNGLGKPGDPLPYSSKYSASLSIDDRFKVARSVTAFVGATAAYVDTRHIAWGASLDNPTSEVVIPPYAYGNLRAGVETRGYTLTAFVKNVTNKRGVLNAGETTMGPTPASGVWTTAYIVPRTIGVSISMLF